jgi:hypothetical protein
LIVEGLLEIILTKILLYIFVCLKGILVLIEQILKIFILRTTDNVKDILSSGSGLRLLRR